MKIGTTVTATGAARTQLTRAQKMARVESWARGLSDDERTQFLTGSKFDALTDTAAEIVGEVFATLENDGYSTPTTDVSGFDFEAETMDVDSLPEDETESVGDSFEVLEGEDVQSFDIDDAAPWPGDAV